MKKDTSQDIIELSDYSHARLRTEMYFGSRVPHTQEVLLYDDKLKPFIKEITWIPALYTYFREAIDNACDEVISHKGGNSIWITYDTANFVFSIEDNGRGIPIDLDKDQNVHKATIALSRARAGRNFQERQDVAGANGLGIACTNFCSEFFKVEIQRDNKKFTQDFQEGNVLINDLIIKKPKVTANSSKITGTKITFKPSKYVFETVPKLENNFILPEEFVRSRIVEIAITNPNVKIYYNNQKINVKSSIDKTLFDDEACIIIDIDDKEFSSKFILLTEFATNEFIHSIVNRIPAFNGGSHIDSFKRNFYKGLISCLEKESKRRKLNLSNTDIQQEILIFNVTNMKAPNFDSQSKSRLINENAGTIVRKALEDEDLYKTIVKKNKNWIEKIYTRCAERTNKKDDAEISKLSKKIAKNKVPKLMDANGRDRRKCILIITEGESAKSGIREARNQEIHAALDLKGKPMNVRGTKLTDVLNNSEIADIMNSIGLRIGTKAERNQLRFGKIYIAHDMDPDGANIGALLINFFYLYWPELFDTTKEPFIYIFQTPYLIGEHGKQRKYWYASDYHEYDPIKHKEWKITRAKGLATLMKTDWEHSLANPNLIPITEDENLSELLDLIFNENRADDRKTWLS